MAKTKTKKKVTVDNSNIDEVIEDIKESLDSEVTPDIKEFSVWIKVNDKVLELGTNDVMATILEVFKKEDPKIAVTIKIIKAGREISRWLSPRDVKQMKVNQYFRDSFINNLKF